VPDRLIVDTSPLIFLARAGGLPWLYGACTGTVDIPRGVLAEVAAGADGQHIIDMVIDMAATEPRMRLLDDTAVAPVVLAWDLGLGETQVLAHCLPQAGAVAVLDNAAARQCAHSLGIPVVGTLGVVLAAKRMGFITEARPLIARLLEDGLYLHPSLITGALAEVGE
jgi:predicted nucleic acid-binding protein